jgi:hypothetical protein
MMKRYRSPPGLPEDGVSEILAQFLIIFLVIILIAIVIGDVSGIIPKMLQKPALVSVKASAFNTTSGVHVISLLNQQGNPVNINGTGQTDGVSPLSFTLTHSNTDIIVKNSSDIAKKAWNPGDRIYIYRIGTSYYVTDNLTWLNTPVSPADDLSGLWSVNVIDARISQLLHKLPVELP